MSKGQITGKAIINTLITAGERAFSKFHSLSDGGWLDDAPEYFLTSSCAISLKKYDRLSLLLEVPVASTQREAKATRVGRPADADRRNGRYDMVIFRTDGFPRGVIEVKSPVWAANSKQLCPDFERLSRTLSANKRSTFQFCAFLFYSSVSQPERRHDNASQKLRRLLERIEPLAKQTAQKHRIRHTFMKGPIHQGSTDDGGAWCVSCIVFSKPGGEQSFR